MNIKILYILMLMGVSLQASNQSQYSQPQLISFDDMHKIPTESLMKRMLGYSKRSGMCKCSGCYYKSIQENKLLQKKMKKVPTNVSSYDDTHGIMRKNYGQNGKGIQVCVCPGCQNGFLKGLNEGLKIAKEFEKNPDQIKLILQATDIKLFNLQNE